jgi:hypothetical protein
VSHALQPVLTIRHQPKRRHNRYFVMRGMRLRHGSDLLTPPNAYSSINRTFTFLPFTLPELSLRNASRAALRSIAT